MPSGKPYRRIRLERANSVEAVQEDRAGWTSPDEEAAAYYRSVSLSVIGTTDLSTAPLPAVHIDQLPTQPIPRVAGQAAPGLEKLAELSIDEITTQPLLALPSLETTTPDQPQVSKNNAGSYGELVRHLVKSSGIYALAAVGAPFIALLLTPFLTHHLSETDYGILTILTTVISLSAGISQLGLSSAFFRAYNYDYSSDRDRRAVVSTVTLLLSMVSLPLTVAASLSAPLLAGWLFGEPSQGRLVLLAALAILMQNLSVPGFAWLRAENRPLLFSLLSLGNLSINLAANLVLVGVFRWGIAGALIATVSGYACVVLCTTPIVLLRAGLRFRLDVARGLLAFGLPLVLNFVSYWVLQVSDRYLLSIFGSLAQTATYSVAYTLGSALAVVVMGPFTLAWPTTMFTIAKRKDAPQVFKLVFRWFSILLLFIAFAFAVAAHILLNWFFPASYLSAAPVIPFVAQSIVFYGVYYVFMVGANIKRKTWLAAVFTTTAAVVNVGLNLVLIPRFFGMGAAASTLIAYIIMAAAAYVVNQRLYPVPFEIPRFVIATLLAMLFYLAANLLPLIGAAAWLWPANILGVVFYGVVLFCLGRGWEVLRQRRAKKAALVTLQV